jgi:hypothetical protein
VHLGERDSAARELQRGLDESLPRQPPEPLPQLAQRGRQARDRTRRRPDRVDDDLLAERDGHLEHVADLGGHGREPVDVGDARTVEDDRVAPREEPAHHRLSDARGERHGDDRVRGRAAVGEDLDPDLGRGRMPRRYARSHRGGNGARNRPHLPPGALPCP